MASIHSNTTCPTRNEAVEQIRSPAFTIKVYTPYQQTDRHNYNSGNPHEWNMHAYPSFLRPFPSSRQFSDKGLSLGKRKTW